jgi:glutathione peroxidase
MNQEPGSNAEIKAFARDLYQAEFPLFAKTEVNGANTCEVYKYLRNHSELYDATKKQAKEIPWNFAKFLVDSNGQVVQYYPPKTLPDEFESNIKAMLK